MVLCLHIDKHNVQYYESFQFTIYWNGWVDSNKFKTIQITALKEMEGVDK